MRRGTGCLGRSWNCALNDQRTIGSRDSVLRTLDAKSLLSDEDRRNHPTLGGLAMLALDGVPWTGDVFERCDDRVAIVDLDGNHVDACWRAGLLNEGGRYHHASRLGIIDVEDE